MAAEHPSPLAVPTGGGIAAGAGPASSPAYRKPEDSFRDEIARVIFGDIGAIRDDYSCAVESKILLHGRMYITDKFICFYSNFFGFEKKIKIPFSHVLKVTKGNTALLIPNSINIVTSRKEYCFRSFWDRDECYYQMATAFRSHRRLPPATREALLDSRAIDKDGNIEASSASAAASSPFPSSSGIPPAAAAAEQRSPSPSPSPSPPPIASPPASPTADDGRASTAAETAATAATMGSNTSSRASLDASSRDGGGEDEAAVDTGSVSGSSFDEDDVLDFDDLREGTRAQMSVDLRAAFERALLEEAPLRDKGLDVRLPRPVTVQEFFEEFIADRAPLGVDKYHDSQGDKELQISPWQEVNQGVGATRILRFVTPIEGLPVGPPTASVLQQQRVRVFGQHGMIWEASTTMGDVPAADCFTLEDRWVISPADPDAALEQGGLRVQTTFEVRFVKSTFFRKIIEGRSSRDTLHYHKTYFEMVEKHATRKHRAQRPASRQSAPGALQRPLPRLEKRRGASGAATGEKGAGAGGELLALVRAASRRIKWDRFVVAVLVFSSVVYALRFLLSALLPAAPHPSGVTEQGPSPAQWEALLAELRALRMEVHDLRAEVQMLGDRVAHADHP